MEQGRGDQDCVEQGSVEQRRGTGRCGDWLCGACLDVRSGPVEQGQGRGAGLWSRRAVGQGCVEQGCGAEHCGVGLWELHTTISNKLYNTNIH